MVEPGLQIADYELLRHVAGGATSDVYEGRHAASGQPVAVKVLYREHCLDDAIVTRFLNEACALQELRHARILTIITWGRLLEGRPFMVLEWLPHTLAQALARAGGAVPSRVAASLAAQMAEALAALHDRGAIHRDLKPANVLLTREDLATAEIKLADLGLAKILRETTAAAAPLGVFPISTGGSDRLGTWEYMAPEQWIRSKSVDPKADVYALGVLLFQMIAGRLPFVAEHQKEWMGSHLLESPPMHLLAGRAVRPLRDLVAQMLGKKAAPRPTMGDVAAQLTALQSRQIEARGASRRTGE